MRALIVDDDPELASLVRDALRRHGLAADTAYDGEAAIEAARLNPYDVVVLDRAMPGVHGDEVCRSLSTLDVAPRVLMLTAASDPDDVVTGLTAGADDYLTKPFAMPELLARVLALSRRPSLARRPVTVVADLELDPATMRTTRAGRNVELSPKEFNLLAEFVSRPDEVISAEELIEKVWDDSVDPFSNIVRVTTMTLRRKPGPPPLIHTVRGAGYRLASGTGPEARPNPPG